MTLSNRATPLIDDAWSLHEDAQGMLSQGRLRNVAEMARGATEHATDAVILERTGREPGTSGIACRGIRALRHQNIEPESLVNRYSQRVQDLHGSVFYDSILDPQEPIVRDIHATADYSRDAERLADVSV